MFLGLGVGTSFGNPVFDAGFNTTADFNTTGFSADEIDSGGFINAS